MEHPEAADAFSSLKDYDKITISGYRYPYFPENNPMNVRQR